MENTDKKVITITKKSWSDPEISILSIKDDTLGAGNPNVDGGNLSG